MPALPLLNSFKCPLAVFLLADLFHQSFVYRRAFCFVFRRGQFGPFWRSRRSFTPVFFVEGQLKLGFLPLVAHELHRVLASALSLLAEDRLGLHRQRTIGYYALC